MSQRIAHQPGPIEEVRRAGVNRRPNLTPYRRPKLTPPLARCSAVVPVVHRFVGRGAECPFRDRRSGAPGGPVDPPVRVVMYGRAISCGV